MTKTVSAESGLRSDTDVGLVARVRAGDDRAFEELYHRYRRRITGYLLRMVRDPGRAEDLTQDTFVAALRRMRETDSEIVFKPWVYEIARNAAIDLHRRAGRTNEVSIDPTAGLPASDMLRYWASPGPETIVLGRERFEHFRDALDELPDTQQEIIVLRELEGLSYREIGDRMDLTPTAVESTLFRARRKLADEYEQAGTGRRCVAVSVALGRMAAGDDGPRDRTKVARHVRRCAACRREARALGFAPESQNGKVATLIPVAALPELWSKAVSVLAAGAIVVGGGATLGGGGPLEIGADGEPAPTVRETHPRLSTPAPPPRLTAPERARRSAPARPAAPGGGKDTPAPGGGARQSPPAPAEGRRSPEPAAEPEQRPHAAAPDISPLRPPAAPDLPRIRIPAPGSAPLPDTPALRGLPGVQDVATSVEALRMGASGFVP